VFPTTRAERRFTTPDQTNARTNAGAAQTGTNGPDIHPAWIALIEYCRKLRYGDIERLRIQDGVPVLAEVITQKVKFSN
jgi:hypothetical protein